MRPLRREDGAGEHPSLDVHKISFRDAKPGIQPNILGVDVEPKVFSHEVFFLAARLAAIDDATRDKAIRRASSPAVRRYVQAVITTPVKIEKIGSSPASSLSDF